MGKTNEELKADALKYARSNAFDPSLIKIETDIPPPNVSKPSLQRWMAVLLKMEIGHSFSFETSNHISVCLYSAAKSLRTRKEQPINFHIRIRAIGDGQSRCWRIEPPAGEHNG